MGFTEHDLACIKYYKFYNGQEAVERLGVAPLESHNMMQTLWHCAGLTLHKEITRAD